MIRVQGQVTATNCLGVSRRSFLQAGFLGLAGLSLGDLLRIRAADASPARNAAVILIWLDGGPPQHETYDPKPDAPAEYRGSYHAIETNVSGLRISELLPRHAKLADKMAFVRSVHHDNGDHFAGAHMMLTGLFGATGADTTPRAPSAASYVAKVRGPNRSDLPAYVGLPQIHSVGISPGYHGANWLGAAYDPFLPYSAGGNDGPKAGTPTMFKISADAPRLSRRSTLLEKVDLLNRAVDHDARIANMDLFTRQALNTLLSPSVKEAFDLDAEPSRTAK